MAETSTENPTTTTIVAASTAMEDPPAAASAVAEPATATAAAPSAEQSTSSTAATTAEKPKSKSTSSTTNNSTTTTSSDFEPPAACIRRLLKQTLPKSTNISKDSLSALSRASGIFILYLTACANDVAREGRRTTIVAKDVIGALKELEFEEFVPAMERFLEGHRREERSKKEEKERMKNSVGEKRDKEGKFVSGSGKEEEEVEEGGNEKNDDAGGGGTNVDGDGAASAAAATVGGADKKLEGTKAETTVKTATESQIGAADAPSFSMKDVATTEKHPREEEENNEDGAMAKRQKLDGEGS
mmetsp:Transcript_1207/g.1896  ORF Transcript_1207/g.1896 Transcript_1207/m.1896 type:complete len:301 (-) Transcript_1207:704-1606(-)